MASHKYGTIEQDAPSFVQYLVNKDDRFNYIGSAKKVDWICPQCGSIVSGKSINKVISKHKIPCQFCSDGTSRPEKIVLSALIQSGVEFDNQVSFTWSGRRRYDFYLPDCDSIIEVHGAQHYGFGFQGLSGLSYEDQTRIDKEKMDMALANGIKHYFIVNAKETSAIHIVPQVSAILRSLGVTTMINTRQCESDAGISNIAKSADMWNSGMWSGDIASVLHVRPATVVNYLKVAASIGLCDYTPYKAHLKSQMATTKGHQRGVVCVTTGEVFESLLEARKKYNISSSSNILRACNDQSKHAGRYKGVKLAWAYA